MPAACSPFDDVSLNGTDPEKPATRGGIPADVKVVEPARIISR
jgi:hypothetical protein